MEFEIKIKPLVLFDLQDKIEAEEQRKAGSGKHLYEDFLNGLAAIKQQNQNKPPVYETVQEYIAADALCKLFYMVNGSTIYVMGLL